MPVLLRLNAELLATQVAADLDLDRAQASVDRATTAMQQAAETAARLPDLLSAERARLVADVRAEAERLGDAGARLPGVVRCSHHDGWDGQSELLFHVHETLDAPGLTRLTPEVETLLVRAEERARRWLYTAFALACALIVCAGASSLPATFAYAAAHVVATPQEGGYKGRGRALSSVSHGV